MIACIDVGYSETEARAACVVIGNWGDSQSTSEHIATIRDVQDYQPGEFYLRELPCIEAVLAKLDHAPSFIVVDGYVWLDDQDRKGLGAYLFEALEEKVPVIGVAKNPFRRSAHATHLRRGESDRPLYITAAGIELTLATDYITQMHGPFREPTILKRVDQLSRGEKAVNAK